MPVAAINIKYVNPPKQAGGKYGSVKTDQNIFYSYEVALCNFQPNTTVTVEYEETPGQGGRVFNNIKRVLPTSAPGAAQAQGQSTYTFKDKIITRIAIAKSCIEAGNCSLADAQSWLDWVEGRTRMQAVEQTRPAPLPPPQYSPGDQGGQDWPIDDDIPF